MMARAAKMFPVAAGTLPGAAKKFPVALKKFAGASATLAGESATVPGATGNHQTATESHQPAARAVAGIPSGLREVIVSPRTLPSAGRGGRLKGMKRQWQVMLGIFLIVFLIHFFVSMGVSMLALVFGDELSERTCNVLAVIIFFPHVIVQSTGLVRYLPSYELWMVINSFLWAACIYSIGMVIYKVWRTSLHK
jgi:hypothetical protein